MIPVLSQFLSDNESLFEYERNLGPVHSIRLSHVCRRLIAAERLYCPQKPDMYYDGLESMYLSTYHDFCELIWKLPYDLSKEYFTFIGKNLFVKAERFDGWMNMITHVPPLLIVAAAYLDCFRVDMLQRSSDVYAFVRTYLSTFRFTAQLHPYIPDLDFLVHNGEKLHDLHIHLNGSTETDVMWNYMLSHISEVVQDYDEAYKKSAVRKLSEQVIADFTPSTLLMRLKTAEKLRNKMLQRVAYRLFNLKNWKQLHICNLWGELKNECRISELQEELLFYIIVLNQIRVDKDEYLASCLHHYLLIKGLVHRFAVMQRSQKSFTQFQILTENSFRYGIENKYRKRFMQLSTCGQHPYLATIEGRFSPKRSFLDNLRLVRCIVSGFKKAKKNNTALAHTELTLVAHFIKAPEQQLDKKIIIRHSSLRKDLEKKALALANFIHSSKEYGNYIVGIDAAANEMDAGPEVFAPIFRYLRKRGIQHATFHVGEDFRHLLSGLRSIWEAMYFLDLQPGDRLGHCTAVGISPQLWSKRIGDVCFVSQGEWLDDLVFAWELVKNNKLPNSEFLCLRLESKIHELSFNIYGKDFPPFILAKVWKLRKYNPFCYIYNGRLSFHPYSINDNEEDILYMWNELRNEDVEYLYYFYHEVGSARERYNQLIQISATDLISAEEMEIFQNVVLNEIAKKRIVIEALPSSNLRISYYNALKEYHLQRWLNQDTHDTLLPAVVLGTDDPGIFMTNIYNEYARSYLHLEECGFSTLKRMEILSNLQKCSTIYKFHSHG